MFKLLALILLATSPSSSLVVVSQVDFVSCPPADIVAQATAELQAQLDIIQGPGKAIVAEMKCVSPEELKAIGAVKA